jgi:hypothetical protein
VPVLGGLATSLTLALVPLVAPPLMMDPLPQLLVPLPLLPLMVLLLLALVTATVHVTHLIMSLAQPLASPTVMSYVSLFFHRND